MVRQLGALQGELFLAIRECASDADRAILRSAEAAIDRCTSRIAETIRSGIHSDEDRARSQHAALLRAAREALHHATVTIAAARAGAVQAREARARARDMRDVNDKQQARLDRAKRLRDPEDKA